MTEEGAGAAPTAAPPVAVPDGEDLAMRVVDVDEPRTPAAPKGGGALPEGESPTGRKSFLESANSMSSKQSEKTQNYDDLLNSMGAVQSNSSEELDADIMAQDVRILKSRLASMSRGLLDPRSKMMQYWDFFTLGALFFTSTVTPYEVCLMWDEVKFVDPNWATPPAGPLFVINWFVNLIFIVDVVFNFFLPYKESVKKGGGMVKSHRRIAKNYLCGWFPIDFVSVIPVDNIMSAIDTSQLQGASVLGAIRMLRLLRLLKLARILRASRIFSRWENSISMSYATQSLLKWAIGVTLMLHMFACVLGLLAQLTPPTRTSELQAAVKAQIDAGDVSCHGCTPDTPYGPGSVCSSPCLTPCEVQALATMKTGPGAWDYEMSSALNLINSQSNWVCRYVAAGKIQSMPVNHGEIWVAGLYVAMIQLGGGVGSIVPENLAEYILFLMCIILGSVTWAMVVGTICATLSTGDPHAIAFKQNMDSLNYFLEDMQMPSELRVQAREYLRNTRELAKKRSYIELMELLSPDLKQVVVMRMSKQMLDSVWYFQGLEDACIVEISMRIGRAGYAPREKIPVGQLNILMRGVAAKSGNIMTPVTTWGEDIIVTSLALREKKAASALTFVEIASITRTDLDEVLEDYPVSAQFIRKAAMKIAMQRAIVVVSEFVKMSRDKKDMANARTSQLFAAIQARNEGSQQVDGVQIMQMLTGLPIKEAEELEAEEAAEEAMEEMKIKGGKADIPTVLQRLEAEAAGRKRLEAELKAMKGSLDAILQAVKK